MYVGKSESVPGTCVRKSLCMRYYIREQEIATENVCVIVWVCVWERERERGTQRERRRERWVIMRAHLMRWLDCSRLVANWRSKPILLFRCQPFLLLPYRQTFLWMYFDGVLWLVMAGYWSLLKKTCSNQGRWDQRPTFRMNAFWLNFGLLILR